MTARSIAIFLAAAGVAVPLALGEPPAGGAGLAGPKVHDTSAPGTGGATFGGTAPQGKERVREVPPQLWMRAVTEALGEGAPGDVRAKPEQMDQVRALNRAFMAAQKAYMQAHEAEFRELRQKVGEKGRGPGGPGAPPPPPQGQPAMEPTDANQREQAMVTLRDLRDAGPNVADLQKQVWAILTPEQQRAVEARLVEAKKAMSERELANRLPMEAKRVREKLIDKAPPRRGPGGAGGPGGPGPEGGMVRPDVRDRIMQLLARLSPEQQEQVLRRLEERLAGGGADQGDGGLRPPPPSDGQPPAPPGQERRKRRPGAGLQPPMPPPPPAP